MLDPSSMTQNCTDTENYISCLADCVEENNTCATQEACKEEHECLWFGDC